jgi:glutamate dehydrogenase/leucine dehydrogenase
MKTPRAVTPHEFLQRLAALGTRRACFVFDDTSKRVRASHHELEPLADWLASNTRDFDAHEAIFIERGAESGALMGAFVHRTVRGQAQGGLRYWPYDDLDQFLSDGLRLARGMGRKNALAGLWWGGGKGVIARDSEAPFEDPSYRRKLYRDYGAFISSLNGVYITAEDVGTRPEDMASVFSTTRFVTCIPHVVGGSGNPSPKTAKGVVCAMRAALKFAGLGSLSGKTIAMQGIGNVGSEMVDNLLAAGVARIIARDISTQNVEAVRQRFRGAPIDVSRVDPGDSEVLEVPCDVVAPNALGGILNPSTIPKLQAKVVCGAANNQLLDEQRDAELLRERGIVFVPDFVGNRMGIVNCANEQYGRLDNDPAIMQHFDDTWEGSVFRVTERVLERAREKNTTPTHAANQLADELSLVFHPIWGHRGRQIIEGLLASEWHRKA